MTGTFRPGRRIACFAVLAALPLTACAAGYQAETSRERATLTSVNGVKGPLSLRNVFIVGPADAGGDLPVYAAIFNGGLADDRLVSVSSSGARGGFVPAGATIPARGNLKYNEGDARVPRLTGVKSNALVGQTVPVTFRFSQEGDLTLNVPVMAATPGLAAPSQLPTALPTRSASASATPSAGGSASATPSASGSASASPSANASATPSP